MIAVENHCTIYFVRHPETEWNVEGRYQGRSDSAVTRKGLQKTTEFVDSLQLLELRAVYYAENERTCFLAKKISARYPQARLLRDKRLNERHGGSYEGKLYGDIYKNKPVPEPERRFSEKPPGGESYEMLMVRVGQFIDEIENTCHFGENILCVTSSGVIRTALRYKKGLSIEEMFDTKIPNLSLVKVN